MPQDCSSLLMIHKGPTRLLSFSNFVGHTTLFRMFKLKLYAVLKAAFSNYDCE